MKTMKTKRFNAFVPLALLSLYTLNCRLSTAQAQGTAFTYQGQLQSSGIPANGLYDFRFKLFGDPLGDTPQVGSSSLADAVPVTNGLFTATLNFGEGIFNGSNYWLEVDVRTNNPANTLSYITLTPDQPLTPTPYAIFAASASNVSGTISSTSLAGTYGNAINLTNANNSVSGSFTGNGANVTNVNAVSLNGLNATNFWQLGGNVGTTAGVNYLGTADNQPLEMHVNGLRGLRLEFGGASSFATNKGYTVPNGAPNVIGGSPVNFVTPGVVGAVIGGGGATNFFGTIQPHSIGADSDYSVIGGGLGNTIQSNSLYSTIAGGVGNTIQPGSYQSTIGGGGNNTISADSAYSLIGATIGGGYGNQAYGAGTFVGGGYGNQADGPGSFVGGGGFDGTNFDGNFADAPASFIGGGLNNATAGYAAMLGGGFFNQILSYSPYSFIGGGLHNIASGDMNDFGTLVIAGGDGNVIASNSWNSAIVGGQGNLVVNNSHHSFIGGGLGNQTANAYGTVGGGNDNTNLGFAGTVAGGQNNTVGNNFQPAVGGGYGNQAAGHYATVPGGFENLASGEYSFAAGDQAQATFQGSFVWSDSSGSGLAATNNNSVTMRATGGYRLFSSASGGVFLAAGSGSWNNMSDRNAKDHLDPVNPRDVLAGVVALPISKWSYKTEEGVRHVGPMAQDFHQAFTVGENDTSISTVDEEGVALAAIQGLNQKVDEKEARIQEQATEIQELKQSVDALKKLVQTLAEKKESLE